VATTHAPHTGAADPQDDAAHRVTQQAIRTTLPLALSVAPFGAALGVTMAEAQVPAVPGLSVTAVLYAGSAQLATLAALLGGGSVLGAVVLGVVVNARLLLYSAALGDRFRRGQPRWFRWVGPTTIIDQTVLLARGATGLGPAAFRRLWLVSGAVLGAVWVAAVALGARLIAVLPATEAFRVAAPAVLVALVMGSLADRRHRRAALVASAVCLIVAPLPGGLGTLLAIGAGVWSAGPGPEVGS
jgi:predicted branched-subunit amino acid permease